MEPTLPHTRTPGRPSGSPHGRPSGSPDVSVVIVNYNGGTLVVEALRSLAAQAGPDFEVVVVDNASEDGSTETLEALRADEGLGLAFTLIHAGENIGFAAGANKGARAARGEWVVMFNPDAVADPDWLAEVREGISRHPHARQFACLQLEADDTGVVDGAGDCWAVYGFAWRAAQGHARDALPTGDRLCFSACGASAVYHRETFLALGGFDERFFCYLEDVDMGYRLQRAGHDCVWLSRAVVRHADGGTTRKLPGFREFHTARNRIWVMWKNTPALVLLPTLVGWAAMSAFLAFRGIGTREPAMMWEGYRAGLRNLPERPCRYAKSPWAAPARVLGLRALLRRLSWSPIDHKRNRGRFRALESPGSLATARQRS